GNGWSDTGDDRDMDRGDHSGPPAGNYYREGDYERSCHQGNVAAGTIFGALAGGLIGSAASHGNGGAVAGGVILGGLVGNTLARDVDCDDQRYPSTPMGGHSTVKWDASTVGVTTPTTVHSPRPANIATVETSAAISILQPTGVANGSTETELPAAKQTVTGASARHHQPY